MYILTKFFGEKEYRDDFVNGKLYLSSMAQFTQLLPERALMEAADAGNEQAQKLLNQLHNDEQRDIYEGTIAALDKKIMSRMVDDKILSDPPVDVRARAVGYAYSNISCFCKINYVIQRDIVQRESIIKWDEPDMHDFGRYAVIVIDQKEFIKRIERAAMQAGYQYLCGSVSYHPLKCGEKVVKSGSLMHLLMDKEFSIDDLFADDIIEKYDAFDKWNKFQKQNEWRLVINKNEKMVGPLVLNVGSLEDIVKSTDVDRFAEDIDKLFLKKHVLPSEEGFYGNISREKMRDEFYQLGDNKAYLMPVIGQVEYEE